MIIDNNDCLRQSLPLTFYFFYLFFPIIGVYRRATIIIITVINVEKSRYPKFLCKPRMYEL